MKNNWNLTALGIGVSALSLLLAGATEVSASGFNGTPRQGDRIAGYIVTTEFKAGHGGVDIATPEGTPLYLIGRPGEAIATQCRFDPNNGNVLTYNSMGYTWQYSNLSQCSSGQQQVGSVVALSGNTGVSYGPHLHIKQIQGGQRIAPQKWAIYSALTGEMP